MKAPAEEVLALMDSCVVRFTEPYTEEAAPYLLERAQARMNANQRVPPCLITMLIIKR